MLPKLAGTTAAPVRAAWWERHPPERGQGLHHSYHLGNLQPPLLGYPRVLASYGVFPTIPELKQSMDCNKWKERKKT